MTLSITKDWLPGLLPAQAGRHGGEEQFVPLTIRDDASMASYVFRTA